MSWHLPYERHSLLTQDINDLRAAQGVLVSCMLGTCLWTAVLFLIVVFW